MHFGSTVVSGLVLVALATLAANAQAVNRCEGRDGRVTYTDEPCPAGARAARKVDDSPPVLVREAAPAADAKDAAKDATKEATKDGVQAAREPAKGEPAQAVRPAARIEPGRVAAAATPEQQMQQIDEQYARQRRECGDLSRRIDYARADVDAAGASQRASAELALRRLQEQFKSQCPRR